MKKKPTLNQLESVADKLGNALGLLELLDYGIDQTQIETIKEVHEEIIHLLDDITPPSS